MMQRLTFHPRHLVTVRDGSKRVTMRFRDPIALGPVDLVFEFPDEIVLAGTILGLVERKVCEVTDAEAKADGFAGSTEVLPALREYYPDLTSTDDIVIVSFDVEPV